MGCDCGRNDSNMGNMGTVGGEMETMYSCADCGGIDYGCNSADMLDCMAEDIEEIGLWRQTDNYNP